MVLTDRLGFLFNTLYRIRTCNHQVPVASNFIVSVRNKKVGARFVTPMLWAGVQVGL
jgi:hypothetical protein